MKARRALVLALCISGLSMGAWADKVTRSVDSQGVPTLTIKGGAPGTAPSAPVVTKPKKEFQVYQLDGEGLPAAQPAAREVIVVGYPPPIAPNPAAFNYGYGYGFGYPGYPGYPCGPVGYPANYYPALPTIPAPLNYQNPPVNYQNPPLNYQNRVPIQPVRWR